MSGGPDDVIVHDVGVDAVLRDRVLVLSPSQTFESAVASVAALFPELHPDEVRALVRRHLPDAVDLEDVLRPVVVSRRSPGVRWGRRVGAVGAVLAGAGCLLAGAGLAVHLSTNPAGREARADLTARAHLECDTVSKSRARCVDSDGVSLAADFSGGNTVILSSGGQVIWARQFETDARAAVAAETMNRKVLAGPMPDAVSAGPWVIWGPELDRVTSLARVIRASGRDSED